MKKVFHSAQSRGHADHGWLEANYSFSFASYFNPQRSNFGALRVLNDDTISPGKGFGTHPHDNMEIITIPLKGDLEHKDSMGNIGVINEGERVETIFTFTNTGKADLIIQDARGSCGCTVPEYPKNVPIAPGDSGKIRVSFDSSNKPNLQQKTVTITANTDSGRETIRIKAMVTADPIKQQQREAAQAARLQQPN